MYTKLTIACALITGLLLLPTCMGGAQGSLLSENAMRAAIGHSEAECTGVTTSNCGGPKDNCEKCISGGAPIQPCPDSGETLFNDTYDLCQGSGSKTCRIEKYMSCGRQYICDSSPKDNYQCGTNDYGQQGCFIGNPNAVCQTCARGEPLGDPDEVIDYYCQ